MELVNQSQNFWTKSPEVERSFECTWERTENKAPGTANRQTECAGCPQGSSQRIALFLSYHKAGHFTRKTLSETKTFDEKERGRTMRREGLTVTMVFLAESANYGEGIGNISTLKKMSRGNHEQYSYISRQAMRYNIVRQADWDQTPVDGKSGVVQFAPSATIVEYPEIDLFGYMKTVAKDGDQKGGASTRSAVVRLSNAIALEPFLGNLEFLTNMGLAARGKLENEIAQSEIQRSFYTYTITVDLDRVGIDGEVQITGEEKANRVKTLLDTVQYLYRDIKGRRENLSPLFAIGGRYERRNPFFENRIRIENDQINVETLAELLEDDAIRTHTFTGVVTGIFDNENEIRGKLSGESVGAAFRHLKEEVEQYYGESN